MKKILSLTLSILFFNNILLSTNKVHVHIEQILPANNQEARQFTKKLINLIDYSLIDVCNVAPTDYSLHNNSFLKSIKEKIYNTGTYLASKSKNSTNYICNHKSEIFHKIFTFIALNYALLYLMKDNDYLKMKIVNIIYPAEKRIDYPEQIKEHFSNFWQNAKEPENSILPTLERVIPISGKIIKEKYNSFAKNAKEPEFSLIPTITRKFNIWWNK